MLYAVPDTFSHLWRHDMPESQAVRPSLVWRTPVNCDGGACIQVAASGPMILIADSKTPAGSVLSYTRAEFREFIAGVKNGDFDDLTHEDVLSG